MSQTIINDIPPYTQATALAGQTVYGTNWTANVESDVYVYVTPVGMQPNDATQLLNYPSQFTVDFVGALLEVQVTLVTPSNLGDIVTITRQTPADRENLYSNTNFLPSMLNNDFGILTLVDQQAQYVNQSLAPRYNYSATVNPSPNTTRDTILPLLGPSQLWIMNATQTAIEAVDFSSVSGTLTEVDTGLGLTGGPITTTGTISFAPILPHTLWANTTNFTDFPTLTSTSFFLQSANNLNDLTNVAQAQANIGLAVGVNVQAYSPTLTSLGNLSGILNAIPYYNSTTTFGLVSSTANSVLVTDNSSVPHISNTLPITVQTNITQLGVMSQDINMGSHAIHNLSNPTSAQDAATQAYVLSQFGNFLSLNGGTMHGAIDMGNNQINNVANPTALQDAVNLQFLQGQLNQKLSLSGGTMTGNIIMSSKAITNLLDPVNPQDAATKNYVDTVAIGLTVISACYAATTANLTATYANGSSGIGATLTNSGTLAQFTTDGVTPPTNARILVKSQTAPLQNGIYVLSNQGSASVAWIMTRSTDYDQPSKIQPGDLVILNNGTTLGGTSFVETASVGAVGTDPILFSQFTFSATSVLLKANNLHDVANPTISFNNISPLTTKGDMISYDGTNNVRVPVGGSDGQIMQIKGSNSTGLSWSSATYPALTTVNQLLYSSSTNTVTGLSTAVGGILVTDASSVPQFLANPSATGKVLQSVNGTLPAWSIPTYPSLSGATGKIIISDGTNNIYSTPTYPNLATAGHVLIGDGTNVVLSTPSYPNASVTARKVLISDGTNFVASSETYAAPGPSGNILTSDGTNWTSVPSTSSSPLTTKGDIYGYSTGNTRIPVGTTNGQILQVNSTTAYGLSYSNASYPATTTANQLLYSNATNTVVGLTNTNNSVLTINNSGVPTWIPLTDGQLLIGSSSGAPIAASITAGSGITVTPGANSIMIAASGGTGLSWIDVASSAVTLAINTGYICNNGSTLITFTLPTTCVEGAIIEIAGNSAGGWKIAQNAGQSTLLGNQTSTTGTAGYIASSNAGDCVRLLCVKTNSIFRALSGWGNLTFV